MPAPEQTLKITDPTAGTNSFDAQQAENELRRSRIILAVFYIALPIILVFLLFKVFPNYPWPTVSKETNELVGNIPIYFFGKAIATSLEDRLLLLVIVAGALGSYIHSATSYADFRGNRQFNPSWTLWYVLRPLIGVCLAMVVYFATRGGLLLLIVKGDEATKASSINPFGVAAVAGMTGMFSKQAADKLAEVFTTLFKTQGDENRKDSLTPGVPPTITKIDPPEGPVDGATEITITGKGFASGASISIGDNFATNIEVVNDTTIKADTPAGEAGEVDVTVVNADGQKMTLTKGFTYLPADSNAGGDNVDKLSSDQGDVDQTNATKTDGGDSEGEDATEKTNQN